MSGQRPSRTWSLPSWDHKKFRPYPLRKALKTPSFTPYTVGCGQNQERRVLCPLSSIKLNSNRSLFSRKTRLGMMLRVEVWVRLWATSFRENRLTKEERLGHSSKVLKMQAKTLIMSSSQTILTTMLMMHLKRLLFEKFSLLIAQLTEKRGRMGRIIALKS